MLVGQKNCKMKKILKLQTRLLQAMGADVTGVSTTKPWQLQDTRSAFLAENGRKR